MTHDALYALRPHLQHSVLTTFFMKAQPYFETLKNDTTPLALNGLWGSSKAYILSVLKHKLPASALIITPTQKRAEELYEDLMFFQRMGILPDTPEKIHLYSQWNIAPYEKSAPHREIVAERLKVLDKLLNNEQVLVVAPVEALMHRTIPRQVLKDCTIYLMKGEEIERETVAGTLVDFGYKHTHLVEERGEFCVRGGIIDIYPAFSQRPLRVELWGDEIESLREFDPETQRSVNDQLEVVTILPGKEIILSDRATEMAEEHLGTRIADIGASFDSLNTFMNQIKEQVFFPGVEWYAPYFHGRLDSLFEYLPDETVFVLDEASELEKTSRTFHNVHSNAVPPPGKRVAISSSARKAIFDAGSP